MVGSTKKVKVPLIKDGICIKHWVRHFIITVLTFLFLTKLWKSFYWTYIVFFVFFSEEEMSNLPKNLAVNYSGDDTSEIGEHGLGLQSKWTLLMPLWFASPSDCHRWTATSPPPHLWSAWPECTFQEQGDLKTEASSPRWLHLDGPCARHLGMWHTPWRTLTNRWGKDRKDALTDVPWKFGDRRYGSTSLPDLGFKFSELQSQCFSSVLFATIGPWAPPVRKKHAYRSYSGSFSYTIHLPFSPLLILPGRPNFPTGGSDAKVFRT